MDKEVEAWVFDEPQYVRNQNPNRYDHQEYKLKFDIPYFNGHMHIEKYLNWIQFVESFFDYMDILVDKKVKLVVSKLKKGAAAWWEQLRTQWHRASKHSIRPWLQMRQLLKERFLPIDYDQILYQQYQYCQQ